MHTTTLDYFGRGDKKVAITKNPYAQETNKTPALRVQEQTPTEKNTKTVLDVTRTFREGTLQRTRPTRRRNG
jgi:hypothetical protein